MIELKNGIYRLDGELLSPRRKPLILVHPWFFQPVTDNPT